VESDEITSFRFGVSTLSISPDEDGILTASRYDFTAERDGGAVKCTRSYDRNEPAAFTQDADFMKKLQKIVKKYDFAQYNGIDRETHGLPDDFGVSFSVEYASGEKIYASDNQNVFMPLKLTEELAALFMCYAPSYYHYVSIPVEAAVSMMETEEDYLIVDVRRQDEYEAGHIPGAINVPNESIQEWDESVEAALPDRDRLLFIYCRTGRRSKQAAYVLFDSGYTRVYEFGGINDWPGEIEND